jgi:hypothetical protein
MKMDSCFVAGIHFLLLAVGNFLRIQIVVHHPVFGHLLVFGAGLAVIAVWVDAEAATR